MSWDTFKKNILRLSDNPNSIPTIDTVAKAYATEYDACIKRGGDSVNRIPVKKGNVETMELFFKAALSKGLIQTIGYDIVGEMGQGVIAYWSGAVLEKSPVPLMPAIGATVNVSVESDVVLIPGVWKPPLFIPPSTDTKNVIDMFILYAQSHLLTVGGIITTKSLYPPLATPGPGIINWTGYSVTPAPKTIKASALPLIEDDYQKAPLTTAINMSSYNAASFNVSVPTGTSILDDGEVRDNDNEYTTTTYETIGTDPTLYVEPAQFIYNPSNDDGEDYSGYSGAPLSPSDTLRKIYLPVLNEVHKDKPKGLRILMAAQTQVEGFFPASGPGKRPSRSFRTNNPGNVYPDGSKKGFATLALGIEAQWRYIHGPIFNGKSKYYKPSFTLFKYLSIYAPVGDGANNPNSYTNLVIGYFRSQGYKNVDGNTTLEEIRNLK